MAFNKKKQGDFELNMKTPLVEDNVNGLLNSLNENFLEFSKSFEQIKDYGERLKTMKYKEYSRENHSM
jgi:fumarate hydratase class II